jgi:hypothetical protein
MEILLVSAIKAVISIEGKHDYLFAGMAASFRLLLTHRPADEFSKIEDLQRRFRECQS